MKKFTLLLCAALIAFSASAAPVSKKEVLAKKVAKKEIRSQKVAKKASAKALPFKSIDKKTNTVAPAAAPAFGFTEHKAAIKGVKVLKAHVAKAPQAKKETINLTFADGAEFDWTDYVALGGWWQFQAEDDDYYLSLSNIETEQVAGTYTIDDMDLEYSFLYSSAIDDYIDIVSCNIILAVDETDGFKLTITGSFVGSDGNTYNLNIVYQEEPIEPGDYDFTAISESHRFYTSDNDVYYNFKDSAKNSIYFDIVVADSLEDVELGKTYTLDDMIADYSNVTYNDVEGAFVSASFIKTNVDGTDIYVATAEDEFGRIFHLSYTFKAPEALNFDTITGEVSVTEEEGWFWTDYTFIAQDEKNAVSLTLSSFDENYFGTWVVGDDITGSVFNKATETPSDIYSGEVTIEPTNEGFSITGAVLCFNNTEYTLNLTYVKPSKTRDAELTLAGLEATVFDGGWQLRGFNEDETTYVTVAAYTDVVTGKYTHNDLLPSYTFVYTDIVWDEEGYMESANKFKMLSADLDVVFNESDSTLTITGLFLGQNGEDIPEFTFNLSGKIPSAEVSDLTFEISVGEETGISVLPSNDDPWDYYFASADIFEEYGADGIAEVIYSNYGNEYAVTGPKTFAWDDEELLYYCGDGGIFYIVVWGSGANNVTTAAASQEFEFEASAGGNRYDAQDEAFKYIFPEYDVYDQYLAQSGVLVVEAIDDDNRIISLELYVPANTTELTAGVYPINDSYAPQTVGAGYIDGNIYGSFAGNLTEDNMIQVPLWLLVEGKVNVLENGVIQVIATNTWGAQIECQLGSWPEAIDNTDAKVTATKRILNGTLVIEKNGVRYNAQGAVVK